MPAQSDAEGQRRRAEQRRGDDDPDLGAGQSESGETPGERDTDDPVAERPDPSRLHQHRGVVTGTRREESHRCIIVGPAAGWSFNFLADVGHTPVIIDSPAD